MDLDALKNAILRLKGYEGAQLNALIEVDKSLKKKLKNGMYRILEPFIKADDGKTDVVIIAVPNGLHAPLFLKALHAGYHIVIEKPMALTKKKCEKIIFKSLKVNRQVFVVKQNRYSPTSIWLKKVVDENILGNIFMVETSCYWNRDERYYKPDDWHG